MNCSFVYWMSGLHAAWWFILHCAPQWPPIVASVGFYVRNRERKTDGSKPSRCAQMEVKSCCHLWEALSNSLGYACAFMCPSSCSAPSLPVRSVVKHTHAEPHLPPSPCRERRQDRSMLKSQLNHDKVQLAGWDVASPPVHPSPWRSLHPSISLSRR